MAKIGLIMISEKHKMVPNFPNAFLGCAALLLAQPHHPVIFVFVVVVVVVARFIFLPFASNTIDLKFLMMLFCCQCNMPLVLPLLVASAAVATFAVAALSLLLLLMPCETVAEQSCRTDCKAELQNRVAEKSCRQELQSRVKKQS